MHGNNIDQTMIDPQAVLNFCNTVSARLRNSAPHHTFYNTFDPTQGNFSAMALNIYLSTQCPHPFHVSHHDCDEYTPYATSMPPTWSSPTAWHNRAAKAWKHRSHIRDTGIHMGSTQEQILALLPPMTTGFMLHNEIFLSLNFANHKYGHAICIKQHEDIWYMLDSELAHPVPLLSDADWAMLYGQVRLIKSGPAPNNTTLNMMNDHADCLLPVGPPHPTDAGRVMNSHKRTIEPDAQQQAWPKRQSVRKNARSPPQQPGPRSPANALHQQLRNARQHSNRTRWRPSATNKLPSMQLSKYHLHKPTSHRHRCSNRQKHQMPQRTKTQHPALLSQLGCSP